MIPKFRAWDREKDRMIYPSTTGVCFEMNDDGISVLDIDVDYPNDYGFPKIASILMQSTTLKDKNGVEIFEGDIVQWGDTPDWEEEPIRVAVVKITPDIQFDSNVGIFEYGRFIYRDTERFLTVLGNVYENPELLEVE